MKYLLKIMRNGNENQEKNHSNYGLWMEIQLKRYFAMYFVTRKPCISVADIWRVSKFNIICKLYIRNETKQNNEAIAYDLWHCLESCSQTKKK